MIRNKNAEKEEEKEEDGESSSKGKEGEKTDDVENGAKDQVVKIEDKNADSGCLGNDFTLDSDAQGALDAVHTCGQQKLPDELMIKIIVFLPTQDIFCWKQASKFWNEELKSQDFQKLWLAKEHAFINKGSGIIEWSPLDLSESFLCLPRCIGVPQLVGGEGSLICICREIFQQGFSLMRSGRKIFGLSNSRAFKVPHDENMFLVRDVLSGHNWKILVPNLPYTLPINQQRWLFDGEAAGFAICGSRSAFRISLFPLASTQMGIRRGALWRSDQYSWSKVPAYEFQHADSPCQLTGSHIFWQETGAGGEKIIVVAFDLFTKEWNEAISENQPFLFHGKDLEGWLMFQAGKYICGLALVKKEKGSCFEPWRIERNDAGKLKFVRGPLCSRQMAPWDSTLKGLQLYSHGKWIFVGFAGIMSGFDAQKFLWTHMDMRLSSIE